MKVAVIGSGITGLAAAWRLAEQHETVLFEADDRLGGHAHTQDAALPGGLCPVDTGFIVFNTACYPNLIALFDHLRVPTAPTHMGFSVSLDGGACEYNGDSLKGLFGQPSNLVSLSHWTMLRDILRFFREAKDVVSLAADPDVTLGVWLEERGYSQAFIERHIVPMGAAIWSTPASEMLDFPAAAFARFFSNHGLLQVSGRPQWRTVVGGSRVYVSRLAAAFRGRTVLGDAVTQVRRDVAGVNIRTAKGHEDRFDRVLFACHAGQALTLLSGATPEEWAILSKFRYARNEAVLHRDARQMPVRRRVWSSWNYLGTSGTDGRLSVTYWMNKLQPLTATENVFVTLNPVQEIAGDLVLSRMNYQHPMFDAGALGAQSRLWSLQGVRATWFAGSYFGFGFHEDGLQAGLAAAEHMGGARRPWQVTGESNRLQVPSRDAAGRFAPAGVAIGVAGP